MGVDRIWHLFRLLSKDTTKEKKNNKYTSIFILDIPFPFSSNHYIHFEDAKNIQSQTEMRQRKRRRERYIKVWIEFQRKDESGGLSKYDRHEKRLSLTHSFVDCA